MDGYSQGGEGGMSPCADREFVRLRQSLEHWLTVRLAQPQYTLYQYARTIPCSTPYLRKG
jgi:hypothetical protein